MANDGGYKGGMLDGLKKSEPPARDESFKPKGGKVNDDATRSSVGKVSKSPGPRTA